MRPFSGDNPFASLRVDAADVRRAVEVQARSHLLHLREGYLETRGRADALSMLILQSAPAFAALVSSIARLEGRTDGDPASSARHVERIVGSSLVAIDRHSSATTQATWSASRPPTQARGTKHPAPDDERVAADNGSPATAA